MSALGLTQLDRQQDLGHDPQPPLQLSISLIPLSVYLSVSLSIHLCLYLSISPSLFFPTFSATCFPLPSLSTSLPPRLFHFPSITFPLSHVPFLSCRLDMSFILSRLFPLIPSLCFIALHLYCSGLHAQKPADSQQ